MTAAEPSLFVFLGPSLPVLEARRILNAVYLPPVSMGDIYRLMARQPAVIAIIDGLFEQTPAVWHKEILFALSRGVRVLGASSMGALRAAELAAFGMEGVGEVFEAFHSGQLEDDDEVAVAHASAADGYRSLSDAMVNIRAGLREARAAERIGAAVHDRLIAAAKSLYYPDRSWPRLFELAGGLPEIPAGELAALRESIAARRPDVKRADAIRLLQRLAGDGAATAAPAPATPAPGALAFDFEPTYFWEQMLLHEEAVGDAGAEGEAMGGDAVGGEAAAVSAAALGRHLRLHAARDRHPLDAALLLYLADQQAARRNLDPEAPAGAPPAASPGATLLGPADRAALARGQSAVAALLSAAGAQVNRRLAAALAHLGRLEPTLDLVRRKQALLRSLGLRAASPADAGLTIDELLAWYERRFAPIAATPEAHAEQAGFASYEDFVGELALEYMIQHGG